MTKRIESQGDIIGVIEVELIRTVIQDIHKGQETIGRYVDEVLSQLNTGGDKLRKVTVHIDEERM
jgi:uncharacterized protein YaaN involved in tellurite resistance